MNSVVSSPRYRSDPMLYISRREPTLDSAIRINTLEHRFLDQWSRRRVVVDAVVRGRAVCVNGPREGRPARSSRVTVIDRWWISSIHQQVLTDDANRLARAGPHRRYEIGLQYRLRKRSLRCPRR